MTFFVQIARKKKCNIHLQCCHAESMHKFDILHTLSHITDVSPNDMNQEVLQFLIDHAPAMQAIANDYIVSEDIEWDEYIWQVSAGI